MTLFIKVFTLLRTKTVGFRKRYQSWTSKVEVSENTFDQYERTETEVFQNAPTFNDDIHKTGIM